MRTRIFLAGLAAAAATLLSVGMGSSQAETKKP